jgi:uncharacterized protein (DUF488 family)
MGEGRPPGSDSGEPNPFGFTPAKGGRTGEDQAQSVSRQSEYRPVTLRIFTIGHGARPIDRFIELVRAVGIERIADVRTAPGSRKHPQFGRDALEASLGECGIAYEWWGEQLGGFRRARPDSRHVALRTAGFRGYADHMETGEFSRARDELIETSRQLPTAVMCAESVWWRCHRRMLADALVISGCQVIHIMDGPSLDVHRLMAAARIEDGVPVYDVLQDDDGQRRLLAES